MPSYESIPKNKYFSTFLCERRGERKRVVRSWWSVPVVRRQTVHVCLKNSVVMGNDASALRHNPRSALLVLTVWVYDHSKKTSFCAFHIPQQAPSVVSGLSGVFLCPVWVYWFLVFGCLDRNVSGQVKMSAGLVFICLPEIRWFYTSRSVYSSCGVKLHMWVKLCKGLCGSRGRSCLGCGVRKKSLPDFFCLLLICVWG